MSKSKRAAEFPELIRLARMSEDFLGSMPRHPIREQTLNGLQLLTMDQDGNIGASALGVLLARKFFSSPSPSMPRRFLEFGYTSGVYLDRMGISFPNASCHLVNFSDDIPPPPFVERFDDEHLLPAASFDMIILSKNLLTYMDKLDDLFPQITCLLKPGGIMFMVSDMEIGSNGHTRSVSRFNYTDGKQQYRVIYHMRNNRGVCVPFHHVEDDRLTWLTRRYSLTMQIHNFVHVSNEEGLQEKSLRASDAVTVYSFTKRK